MFVCVCLTRTTRFCICIRDMHGHAQVLEKLAKELMMRLDYNGHFSAEALTSRTP